MNRSDKWCNDMYINGDVTCCFVASHPETLGVARKLDVVVPWHKFLTSFSLKHLQAFYIYQPFLHAANTRFGAFCQLSLKMGCMMLWAPRRDLGKFLICLPNCFVIVWIFSSEIFPICIHKWFSEIRLYLWVNQIYNVLWEICLLSLW